VQYRARQIVGYRGSDFIEDPNNPGVAIDNPDVDAYTPVYAPYNDYTVTATVGYKWRLADNRTLGLNLRIYNLLDDDTPIYNNNSTATRPIGGDYTSAGRETVANNYAMKAPLSFNLSAKLSF
jgi:hypothetical protein